MDDCSDRSSVKASTVLEAGRLLSNNPPPDSIMYSKSGANSHDHDSLPFTPSNSFKRAAAELMDLGDKRSRRSIVDAREELRPFALGHNEQNYDSFPPPDDRRQRRMRRKRAKPFAKDAIVLKALGQVPAILLVGLLNLMIGIPFGVTYFPVGWNTAGEDVVEGEEGFSGEFPLPGKEALGIRMFLFATLVGQLAFTFASKFKNAVALQMVENVPFCHALAYIVIAEQGYGVEALSTLFFLFGFASVLVGCIFYLLGKLNMGRVVYFFPSHVLVGCIGGIGVFIILTAMEITLNARFILDVESFRALWERLDLVGVVFAFEVSLRALDYFNHDSQGKARLPLLSPIFFCLITPLFYLGLFVSGTSLSYAAEAGFFFPATNVGAGADGVVNENIWEIFAVIQWNMISWKAVFQSIPTLVALAAFSLIHVPIILPAFGVSTNTECDMNAELIAHGYSNFFSGVFGGLQNYMTYSNSVLYARSGGEGRASSLVIVALTAVLFVWGPSLATYIPRCMAGTLLLHIGIDLFLEGVYDSIGNFDWLEYAGIWVITIVMTAYGMSAALVAGIIAALSTYAVQSMTHHNPIRGTMSAATLRSSVWNRSPEAQAILESPKTGRQHIFVVQLQGHLFFGNMAQITDSLKEMLADRRETDEEAWIVILDFALVVGMDSSAAHAVAKLQRIMHQSFGVEVSIFVTGSGEGFPCEYALSQELSKMHEDEEASTIWEPTTPDFLPLDGPNSPALVSIATDSPSLEAGRKVARDYPTRKVCADLDMALLFAEDILLAREDPLLYRRDQVMTSLDPSMDYIENVSRVDEQEFAITYLKNLCPDSNRGDVEVLFSYFTREEYNLDDVVWKQGTKGNCAKLLVNGTLVSYLENADGAVEMIRKGNVLGELALTKGGGEMSRLTTVLCASDTAVAYNLDLAGWTTLVEKNPRAARLMDGITIRYLAHRVQHVSNRIFETRCLPI